MSSGSVSQPALSAPSASLDAVTMDGRITPGAGPVRPNAALYLYVWLGSAIALTGLWCSFLGWWLVTTLTMWLR